MLSPFRSSHVPMCPSVRMVTGKAVVNTLVSFPHIQGCIEREIGTRSTKTAS